jgi:prophage tail gpP-like protein
MADYPSPEKVGLKIGPNEFRFWASIELTRSLDAMSSVSFTAPFEPARQDFRITFEPFSYKRLEVTVGGVIAFTGTMVGIEPEIDAESSQVKISGYALPAVLEDCPPPADAYPLEFSGMTLLAIAKRLCEPFGFTAIMDEDVADIDAFVAKKRKRGKRGGKGKRGNKFARVALEPGDDAHNFLVGLAQKRGLVMRDRPNGDLLLTDSANAEGPVANLTEDEAPVVSVTVSFKPQDYFSEITAFVPPAAGKPGSSWTAKNPFLTDVVRPHSFRLEDTDPPDCPSAAVAKLGRMFANMVSWDLVVPTWRDPNGDLWDPGTTMTLLAPKAMIYRRTELLIRNVSLKQDANGESASLTLVLPGAFDGAVPSELPWSE